MPKRFTDTEKWKKEFIRSLPVEYKLFWLYILDDCSAAGIWEVEFAVAELRLGIKLSKDRAQGLFTERVVALDNGTKWFIPDFINFQYGKLQPANRAHLSVIHALKKLGLLGDDYNLKKQNKEPVSPLQGAKDKDKVKEMDMDKEMDKDFGKSENLLLVPEMSKVFKKHVPNYPGSKTKDYKPLFSIASYFCEIGQLEGSPDVHAEKIIEAWEMVCACIAKDEFYKSKSLSTISNHIQELTQNALYGKKVNGKSDYGSKERAEEYNRLFAQRYGGGRSTTG